MHIHKNLALLLAAALCLSGCGAAASWSPVPAQSAAEGFSMDLLSTGKSDCALICMDGLAILSDAADSDDLAAILEAMKARGVERLDYLILSHFDKDHIGAAAGVLKNCEVGEIISPDYEESSSEYNALMKAAAKYKVPWTRLTQTRSIETKNGEILLDPPDLDYGDDNNNTLVTVLTWRGQRLVFLGDAEKQRMKEFQSCAVARGLYDLPWAFVKLPHHGDSCKALIRVIEQAKPQWAAEAVSVFESVDAELQKTLSDTGTELFLTRDGAVSILWDGKRLTLTQQR